MIIRSQCVVCQHLAPDGRRGTCLAFPNGIPVAISLNQHDHRHPYPGDNGVHWQPYQADSLHPCGQLTVITEEEQRQKVARSL
jgi:hypothetical protein